MRKLFSKVFSLFILLLHPTIPSKYRWFLRFYYISKIKQYAFVVQDLFIQKPYKTVIFKGEFQQELINVLPYAYWHYKQGTLEKTISSKYTKALYYFSPDHLEKFDKRNWEDNFNTNIPNSAHNLFLNKSRWLPPPLKEIYQNNIFYFQKPILVIANRYNTEWSSLEPISFFNLQMLEWIIANLNSTYQIIYNRPLSKYIIDDNSEVLNLNEVGWLKMNHPEVVILTEFYEKFDKSINSYNEFQLMAYANCSKFISVHGGTATLASYFGGINIIYSKEGLEHGMNEFQNIFPLLSNAKIYHAVSEDSLKGLIIKKIISE